MPTRRGYRGRGRSKSSGEGDYSFGQKIKGAAKKGMEMYLKGTQNLADAIEERLPESMKGGSAPSRRRPRRPRSGGQAEGTRGTAMRVGRRGGGRGDM